LVYDFSRCFCFYFSFYFFFALMQRKVTKEKSRLHFRGYSTTTFS